MSTLIERQIEDWEKRAVIDSATARKLRTDINASLTGNRSQNATKSVRRFSFFQVVLFFAAISFGAAVLIFIAANWEYIPRLVKVGGVVLLIFSGFTGGALVRRQMGPRTPLIEEACYLVAAASFVGGVAMVGQMYHISGDLRAAALLYALGLGLTGLAVRSQVLIVAAVGWMTYWHLEGSDAGNLLSQQFLSFAVFMAIGLAFAIRTKAVWLRRIVYVAVLIGLLPFIGEVLELIVDMYESIPDDLRVAIWVVVWITMLGLLAAERWRPDMLRGVPLFSKPRILQVFLLGIVANGFLHGELGGDSGLIIAGSLMIIFVLAVLYAHGRTHRLIRYLCYVIFAGEIFVIYGETVYSMLGTSGFFLIVALALLLIAFVVYRLERRFKGQKRPEVSDA